MNKYYIVSVKHTRKTDPYITFWRPDNAGYCYALSWAGQYDEATVKAKPDYYNNLEDSFPVPVAIVAPLAISPEQGIIDGNAGPVVQNNRENMRRLRRSWV